MKFVGAILIILASGSFGFLVAQQIALRPQQLRQLKTAVEMLKTEIEYGVTPLPAAFTKIAKNLSSPISQIFIVAQSNLEEGVIAQQAWQNSVSEVTPKTALTAEDERIVLEIGYNLGNSSSKDQIRHLNLAQEQITNCYQEAINNKQQKVKLWRYLGVLTGLLIVIIIV